MTHAAQSEEWPNSSSITHVPFQAHVQRKKLNSAFMPPKRACTENWFKRLVKA